MRMTGVGWARTILPMCAALLLVMAAAPVRAQEECEDAIFAWSSEDTIMVMHEGAWYNCCAEMVVTMEMPEPFIVDFLEEETFPTGPCFCMCCLDIYMWADSFEPGLYLVRVWNEDKTILYGETEVEVSYYGDGAPKLIYYDQSACYGASSVEDDEGEGRRGAAVTTWGKIKHMF